MAAGAGEPSVVPYGDRALLVEVAGLDAVAAVRAALEREPLPGQVDLVPAARTVLVVLDRPPADTDTARLRRLPLDPPPADGGGAPVELPVVFDGPDLEEVAGLTGRPVPRLVEELLDAELTVAFGGFTPGFGYLTGLPEHLHVPRRATPRTRVPAGAVGLAGPFAGAYPRASPGGWQLVGRTDAVLFDVDRSPPALLVPGARVRFRQAPDDSSGSIAARPAPTGSEHRSEERTGAWSRAGGGADVLTVLATGPLATVQDAGRTGWAAIGVPRSGAADRASHDLANRLVGNRPGAATVEVTAGGLRLRAERTVLLAVTGAPLPVTVAGRPAAFNAPVTLPAGVELALGLPPVGLRSYVAVRGGVDVPPVLGSRSTDRLSGLGPAPLTTGDRLPVGGLAGDEPVVDVAPVAPPSPEPVLRVLAGPRRDWLTAGAWTAFTSADWLVSADSDRVGLRLTGPRLERDGSGELPSEGLVPGAVQVPPDGAPVLFLADHPLTGGYPVLAVVVTADLPAAAQLRPGDPVRFRPAR